MRFLILILTTLTSSSLVQAIPNEPAETPKIRGLKHRPAKGWKNRRLHYPDAFTSNSNKEHTHDDAGRSISGGGKGGKGGGGGGGPFYYAVGSAERNPASPYQYSTATSNNAAATTTTTTASNNGDVHSPGTSIYNSVAYNNGGYEAPRVGYTTETNALTTYDNKCDAAEAGAEYRTNNFVPIFFQYEVVTSQNRNILQIVDTIDKACQHFLAMWMVDCFNNRKRHRSLLPQTEMRDLQMTLAPIVGTGAGTRDTVLLGGNSANQCNSLYPSAALGQVCYKVIGTLLVYLDETMQVVPSDVQTLAYDTLAIGMNYGTTDFTELDPDIYELQFIQGYGNAPQDLINQNQEANRRPWDPTDGNDGIPMGNPSNPQAAMVEKGRSGGAKFGIAFATLLCIVIAAFLSVFLYKNRDRFLPAKKKFIKQRRHYNMDNITQTSTRFESRVNTPRTVAPVDDDSSFGNNEEVKLTVLRLAETRSTDAGSVATRSLSPEPETPRFTPASKKCGSVNESNIITPRSDFDCSRSNFSSRSGVSEMTEPVSSRSTETPDDRNKIHTIRPAMRKFPPKQVRKASELVSPDRSYQVEDTVQL